MMGWRSTCLARHARPPWRVVGTLIAAALLAGRATGDADVEHVRLRAGSADPLRTFELPDSWQARFWAEPVVEALLGRDPKEIAALIPAQGGLHFCRCPACGAAETDDPLAWSPAEPEKLTCRRCGASLPNEKFPPKPPPGQPPAPSEDVVEVRPRVYHKYPFMTVEAEKQAFPDERIYLAAKRDDAARAFLARLALYAAVRYRDQPETRRDPRLARLSAAILLRFAQVYPSYAVRYDQPGQPKYFEPADRRPPFRPGYRAARWDRLACHEVPINLAIAYAIIRGEPVLAEAGHSLGDDQPARTIERDLFRAAAEFVAAQPEDDTEASLYACRGLLVAGRLLSDDAIVREAAARLDRLAERGFYYDGSWWRADPKAQRRVVGLLDGWIDVLLQDDARGATAASRTQPRDAHIRSMLELTRPSGEARRLDHLGDEIRPAALGATPTDRVGARLLGGLGVARLAVGSGPGALDIEVGGLGDSALDHPHRMTLRLAVGGRIVLGDLDAQQPGPAGWALATASHNTVLVDGLNQRETFDQARRPAPGSDVLYFATDPDFQVACLEDRHAYATSAARYRQTIVAVGGPSGGYALALFDVRGGTQHDQLFHAAEGSPARWRLSTATTPGPATLLPATVPYVATARPEDGRWFVQAIGALRGLAHCRIKAPLQASLFDGAAPGVRLHLLGDLPALAVVGTGPDPTAATPSANELEPGRAALVVRRRSPDGGPLSTSFVTLFEPLVAGRPPRIRKAGRVAAPEGLIVLAVEGEDGLEHVVINTRPGTACEVSLADGTPLRTDGLVVHVGPRGVALAGGTFAEVRGVRLVQPRRSGTLRTTGRGGATRGWFDTAEAVAEPEALAGRTLVVRHGDGTSRAWTLGSVETAPGGSRLRVVEEPGFRIEPGSGDAAYYQYPGVRCRGPHTFYICTIRRAGWPAANPRVAR
jgi:hypothetical protein